MISHEKLVELYIAMVKCRMVGEAAGLKQAGRSCPEATYAGATADLLPKDTLHAAADCPLPGFVRGASLKKTLAALKRKARSITRPVADPLSAACEAARGHKAAKTQDIAVVFCGDTDAPPTAWKKALSLASKRGLPVVFVSMRSTGEAPAFLGEETVAPDAIAFGVPLITVDGDDVVAVYRVAFESIARARQRRTPTLIDSVHGLGGDCVATMEAYLAARSLFNPGLKRTIDASFRAELAIATASQGR